MELTKTLTAMAVSFSCILAFADGKIDAAGHAIYDSYCGACHGFDGSAPLPDTPDIAAGERMDQPDSELLNAIRTGRGTMMPAWAGILSEEQCKEVLRFIRAVEQ